MSEIVAAILGAILGALVGGYLNFWAQKKAQESASRANLTIRLYEEWQDFEMLATRGRAFEVLREFGSDSFGQLSVRLRTSGRKEDGVAVSRVVHYFELLGALIAENRIDKPTFTRLFERYVKFWLDDGGVRALLRHSELSDGPVESGWTSLVRSLDQYFT